MRVNGRDNAGIPPRVMAVVTFSATTNATATVIGTVRDSRCQHQYSVANQAANVTSL
jgi:hypothetical protein